MQKPTKTGSVRISPVGHTYSGKFGSQPNAQPRGRSGKPTEQKFGGK
jgi:hypothetical protein